MNHPLPIGSIVRINRGTSFETCVVMAYFRPSSDGEELSQDTEDYDHSLRNPYWVMPLSSLTLVSESAITEYLGDLT